nr:TPA_asm: m162.5 sORF [Murid betaherpesvirus 1]DBA07915.1 TPA_asm: m162.5 sORF [Murid betaherpesvirus 1]
MSRKVTAATKGPFPMLVLRSSFIRSEVGASGGWCWWESFFRWPSASTSTAPGSGATCWVSSSRPSISIISVR